MKARQHKRRFWHFALLALLLLALGGALFWAWSSAGRSFANLWLTPDQQGRYFMAQRRYAEAARRFRDPLWQGVALYRAGQFKEAAAAFARTDAPEAVFDRGNALVIPWWSVEQQKLMQATLPALTLEIVAASRWRPWWIVGVGLVLAAGTVGCWCKRRTLLGAWQCWQAQRQASEAGRFSQLQKACRAGDAVAAYNALLRWLDCTHHGPGAVTLADDLLADHADADLRHNVAFLQEAVLHRATSWNGTGLAAALHRTRRERQRSDTAAAEVQLPALNPR
jgi:hypothetical protein